MYLRFEHEAGADTYLLLSVQNVVRSNVQLITIASSDGTPMSFRVNFATYSSLCSALESGQPLVSLLGRPSVQAVVKTI